MLNNLLFAFSLSVAALGCMYDAAFRVRCDAYQCPDALAYARQEGYSSQNAMDYLLGLEKAYKLKGY